MVYLAGDNNLETFGLKDLHEMNRAGYSDEVAVVAQFDRMSDQVTRRYVFSGSPDLEGNCVAQLEEMNTGDPKALLDFISWACRDYPAERYGLILWNHGNGWKDDDIYRHAWQQGVAERITRGQARRLASGRTGRAFFSTTLERLIIETAQTQRAILFDDSSADFLDNIELRAVLQQAVARIGQPIDLLGFDACLMNMLEVHYQIRDLCKLAVGSQESEPGDGWPYDEILAGLYANPGMAVEDLSKWIVDAYVGFYQVNHPRLSVTQSAILLGAIDPLVEALDELAQALIETLAEPRGLGLLFGALRSAQSFSDRDYVDLVHYCRLLSTSAVEDPIDQTARRIADLLAGETSPVIAAKHHGPEVTNANGLSIYLPARSLSPLYQRLEISKKHSWHHFLEVFIGTD